MAEYAARAIARQKHLRTRSVKLFKCEIGYALEIKLGIKTFGEMAVRDVRPIHIKEVVSLASERQMNRTRGTPGNGRTMAPRTLTKLIIRLRSVYCEAVQDQLIYVSPADSIKVSSVVRQGNLLEHVGTVFDFPELARFQGIGEALFKAGLCRNWRIVFAVVSLGLRRGEALGLSWVDVDFKRNLLKIRKVRTTDDGAVIETGTKTYNSKRDIPMPASLIAVLKSHQEQQRLDRARAGESWTETGAMFATSTGNWVHPDQFKQTLHIVLKWSNPEEFNKHSKGVRTRIQPETLKTLETIVQAGKGLPRLRPHDLRHTYATLALRKRVPMEVVSKNLGHAKISITLDIYRHVLESEQREHIIDLFSAPIPERIQTTAAVN